MAKRKITNTLALAVLGLVHERPMHPYEIASTLRERGLDATFKVTTGSLYDTVAALARHGWVAAVETSRSGNRPERTVYAPTELGGREFREWVDELVRTPAPEYPRFLAAVSYLGVLGRDGALDALRERAALLASQIEDVERRFAATAGLVARLHMIEVECALHLRRAELDWVRRTADEIDGGTLAWPGEGA